MKAIQIVIALSIVVALSAMMAGRAAAQPLAIYRASNGALCTADMVFKDGTDHSPFFIFDYEGPHGIASMIFRIGEYYGMPAVYAERVTLGNGTTHVLRPFGVLPAATFGTLFEFEITESGVPRATQFLSLFAVGADLRQVALKALTGFCEDFDPAYFTPGATTAATAATPTPTPSSSR
jgi:hypothetical protein